MVEVHTLHTKILYSKVCVQTFLKSMNSTTKRISFFLLLIALSVAAFFAYQNIRNTRTMDVMQLADSAYNAKNIKLCETGGDKVKGEECTKLLYGAFMDKNVCKYVDATLMKDCLGFYDKLDEYKKTLSQKMKAPFVYDLQKVLLTFENGEKKEFALEVANSPEKRKQGLSYRESLADGTGMLFTFDEVGKHPFHMQDMIMPLDLIFLDKDKKVINERRYLTTCVVMKVCPLVGEEFANVMYVIEVLPQGRGVKSAEWK